MAPKIEELEALSDDEVRQAYKRGAEHVVTGMEWWREELHWRTLRRLTRAMVWMTVLIAVMTLANVVLVAASVFE